MAVGRSPAHLAERPARRAGAGTWGILAAGVVCAALAMATAVRLPVFFGADERPHFAYVVYVVEGRLPDVRDPLPTADARFPILARSEGLDRVPEAHRGPFIYTANHPPLLYLTAALPTWLASQVGDETLPPLTIRLINSVFMGAGVVFTGLLARQIFPRRPGAGVVAAGVAAVTPNLVGVAAYGHNDGLAFALASLALLLVVHLLRQGPTPALVAGAAVVAAACALTRASLAVAVASLVAATVLGGLRHGYRRRSSEGPADDRPADPSRGLQGDERTTDLSPSSGRQGDERAAGPAGGLQGDQAGREVTRWWLRPTWWPWVAGALVAGSAVVLAGWFYVRNQRLYGSPTADGMLLDAFQRVPRGSLGDVLTEGAFHEKMWSKVYGSVHPYLVSSRATQIVIVLVAVGLAGGAAALWARRRRGASPDAEETPDGIGIVGWSLLAAYSAAVVVSVADFVSKGGSMHPRYFFALVPLTSTLLAGAVTSFPAPVRRVAGLATIGALLAVMFSQLRGYAALIEQRARAGSLLLPDRPAEPPVQWVLLGLAVVALVVVLTELWRTAAGADVAAGRRSAPAPAPAGAEGSAAVGLAPYRAH